LAYAVAKNVIAHSILVGLATVLYRAEKSKPMDIVFIDALTIECTIGISQVKGERCKALN
jgi:hypothetical protein